MLNEERESLKSHNSEVHKLVLAISQGVGVFIFSFLFTTTISLTSRMATTCQIK